MTERHPHIIVIDWGTSNLRAFSLDSAGQVLDKRQSNLGIRNVETDRFAAAFQDLVGDWRLTSGANVPVVLSGMIGSRQGWVEANYAPCPVAPMDLASQLTTVPGLDQVFIVPGICLDPNGARHDVMRGEEVQIFGALESLSCQDGVLCLPGTHSKWARVENGAIIDFATAMTGETYQVMCEHTILGTLMTDRTNHDPAAFVQGLDQSATPGGLLQHLFSVRANALFDKLSPDRLSSYLSGILIGHEIQDLSYMADDIPTTQNGIILVGASTLAAHYGAAFEHLNLAHTVIDGEAATILGLRRIAQLANLIA